MYFRHYLNNPPPATAQEENKQPSTSEQHAFLQALKSNNLQNYAEGGNVVTTQTPNTFTPKNVPDPINAGGAYGSTLQAGVGIAGQTMQGIGQAFTAQNGYQAQLAPTDYTNYQQFTNPAGQQALQGYGQAQNIQGQQQQLADLFSAQGNGQGPNPAQMALNQQTGNNVAQQAALLAGQRGSSANTGLAARQAAMAGANTQQQAVGQSAVLQAQQQLAARQALQQQQSIMGQQNIAEQGANNQLFGAAAGAQNAQNNSNIQNYGMMQGINSQVAQNNANAVNKTTGSFMNSAGSLLAMNKGGKVPNRKNYDDGGMVSGMGGSGGGGGGIGKIFDPAVGSVHSSYAPDLSNAGALKDQPAPQENKSGPKSQVGQHLASQSDDSLAGAPEGMDTGTVSTPMNNAVDVNYSPTMYASKGGKVPAMISPGEKYLPPNEVKDVLSNKKPVSQAGAVVPGKAKVKGDSLKNDTVPATLEEGGCVIPRSHMKDEKSAMAFVRAHMKSSGLKGKK